MFLEHNDGTRFHYFDEGEGLPLVFLHGLGGRLGNALELTGRPPGVRIITLDFRGHGLTAYQGSAEAYHIRVFANDVMALLDHLHVERAVIGGVSLGAAVALNAGLRYPDRVLGLVLVRPAWLNKPFPENLDLLLRAGLWIERKGVDGARATMLEDRNFRQLREQVPGAAEGLLEQFRRPQAATSYETLIRLPASVPFLEWEAVEAFQSPAVVLICDHDPLHPAGYGTILGRRLPRGFYRQVASRYQHPDKYQREVQKEIKHFLKKFLQT